MSIPANIRSLVDTDTPLNLVMRVTAVTEMPAYLDAAGDVVLHVRVGIEGDQASFDVEEYPVSEIRLTREAAEGGADGIIRSIADAMGLDLLMGPHDLAEANRAAG